MMNSGFDSYALEDYLALLKGLFDQSEDNIAVYDATGKPVYFNATFQKTINKTTDTINQTDLSWQASFKPYIEAGFKVLETGAPCEFLLQVQHPNLSRTIYDLIHFSPIYSPVKTLIGAISIGRDLDFHDQDKNQELIRREHYQRALLDNFPFMVWLKDKESRFLACNEFFSKVVGAKNAQELVGKTDMDFFPEHGAGYIQDDLEVLATGTHKTVVEPIRHSNGQVNWAETYKSPVTIDGEVIGTVGFARDVSDLKRLEEDFMRSKSEYIALMESLPLTIVRYSLECKRIFVNKNYERTLNVPPETILGTTPIELWHDNIKNLTGAQFVERMQQVIANGQQQVFEIEVTKHQKVKVFLVRIIPEYNNNKMNGVIAVSSDISEVSQYRERVEFMAYHDMLTKLPNRALFNERIVSMLNQTNKPNHQFGILMIDLDYFKAINDSLGHAIGDELLTAVAQRILRRIGDKGIVARLGGDEFAVLVDDISGLSDLGVLASNIVATLSAPFNIANLELVITASIGISAYPQHSVEVDDLLKYADFAMYLAKKQGRNNFQYFDSALINDMPYKLRMQTALRKVIKNNELYVVYQPLVCLHSHEIIGAEALLRWCSIEMGEVSPVEFITVAEELGVIVEIGQWVMREAFVQAAKINANRDKPLIFAVNLSARQFVRNDIFAAVKYCLSFANCNPAWIKLEITESLLLQDAEHVLKTLNDLAALGITIAIDDFGTGYSSLSYLNKFPIHEVKIDQSFVCHITHDENDAKLVKAVIGMAVSLGKTLVAEGVETEEQAALLKSWDCNIGQGFLFYKPMRIQEFLICLAQK